MEKRHISMPLGSLMAFDIEDLKEHYDVTCYRRDLEELLWRQQIAAGLR